MKYPFHEHTPSAEAMTRAARAYAAGMHETALMHYLEAARWADKFAQYNVGVMHLRGEGTEFDPVRAWAWLELSAERDYPQFVETADDLYAMLDEQQRQQARAIYEQELVPRYGDAVKVPRVQRAMRRELRGATGSRTGSQGFLSMLTVYDGSGVPRKGTEFYAPEKWETLPGFVWADRFG
ncbi:MAG: sel1 repeat family protein [Pseudomonadota bacterium]|nr:MAG: sel1 repeat family protein [Pseudomonadota bacterium]